MRAPCHDCARRRRAANRQRRAAAAGVRVALTVRREPPRADWVAELAAVLDRWRGTPYQARGDVAGRGACCYGFLVRALDELHGRPPGLAIPNVPNDLAAHAPWQAARFAVGLMRRYPRAVRFRPDDPNYRPEPGDVLFVRVGRGGGGGHAGIVGADPRQLWHADAGVGVGFTGVAAWWPARAVRAYRSPARHTWRRRAWA